LSRVNMTLSRVKMREKTIASSFLLMLFQCATFVPTVFTEAAATRAGTTFKIRNNNIGKAVRLWMADQRTARRVYGPIQNWDTSGVTQMDSLFLGVESFHDDISRWDVSHVTSMQWIFYKSVDFRGDISTWDVSQVSDLTMAFAYARNFRSDVSKWDTSQVKSLWYAFAYSSNVHAIMSHWNTGSVTSMEGTFQHSSDLEVGDSLYWDTTHVVDMTNTFSNASWFDHVVCWNLTSVSMESLEQVYCDSKGIGGFDCNCVPPDLRGTINNECFFPSPGCVKETLTTSTM